eukprot:TRINITY_DN2095_c0_g1_i8.p1 TRINITY_DN2095_c0_g1~~TRINITY_DN2095_c0_g1_i8.p1  ORF type:complete len:278 (-),score=59.47 TRINITY_DN2095_c0_g1_i8:184-1017(-)
MRSAVVVLSVTRDSIIFLQIVLNRAKMGLQKKVRCRVKDSSRGQFLFHLDPAFVPTSGLEETLELVYNYYGDASKRVDAKFAELSDRHCLNGYLSNNEIKSILFYTLEPTTQRQEDSIYKATNMELRSRGQTVWTNFIYFFIHAILKCPIFYGTIYRGIQSDRALVFPKCDYFVGNRLIWVTVTSCSKIPDKAREFFGSTNQPHKILFIIKQASGRCLKNFSMVPEEDEVLLPPNTVLEVTAVVQHHTHHEVHLMEIYGAKLFEIIEFVKDDSLEST